MKNYCTQHEGRCWSCSLVNAGKDCMNNPVSWWLIADAAKEWGLSERQVSTLLKLGRVSGAERANDRNGTWRMPEDTPRPAKLKTGPKTEHS